MSHSERHERILEEALTGRGETPEVRELLEQCAECRELAGELREVSGWLEAEGRLEREMLEEASRLDDAPGMDRVRAFRPGAVSDEPSAARRGPGGRSKRWIAAVAAVLLAFVLGRIWTRPTAPPPDEDPGREVLLGEGELGGLHPAGEVADFSEFRWQYTLTAGESFQLLVFDDSSSEADTMLERRSHLEENTWQPDPEQLEAWPTKIRWEVRVLSPGGGVKLSEEQSASRSRH